MVCATTPLTIDCPEPWTMRHPGEAGSAPPGKFVPIMMMICPGVLVTGSVKKMGTEPAYTLYPMFGDMPVLE